MRNFRKFCVLFGIFSHLFSSCSPTPACSRLATAEKYNAQWLRRFSPRKKKAHFHSLPAAAAGLSFQLLPELGHGHLIDGFALHRGQLSRLRTSSAQLRILQENKNAIFRLRYFFAANFFAVSCTAGCATCSPAGEPTT